MSRYGRRRSGNYAPSWVPATIAKKLGIARSSVYRTLGAA